MERNFYNEGFEDLLKQKADQYKIYPSDRVWRNIYQSLHSRRKGFTIGGLLLLLLGGFVMMEESLNEHLDKSQSGFTPAMDASRAFESSPQNNPFIFPPFVSKTDTRSTLPPTAADFSQTAKIIDIKSRLDNYSTPVSSQNEIESNLSGKIISRSASNKNAEGYTVIAQENVDPAKGVVSVKASLLTKENNKVEAIEKSTALSTLKLSGKRKNVFGFNVYLAPSVTYRRLSEDKSSKSIGSNLPVAVDHLDVNKFVNHKPALGASFGAGVFYNVSRNFTLKGGLQMNFMRYTISAYPSAPEKIMIALNSTGGGRGDTITSYSTIRNIGGTQPEQFQNQYLQVAMPIGAELKLLGDKPFQLNVAGSLQPTYLLSHSTYLLSDNLANYTKEPSLVRKWNLYSSIETYISYQSGDVRIQIGPQFRYQLLSSYDDRYPIREYLMEYGLKFGVIKTLK
jgi:hypothetical protein